MSFFKTLKLQSNSHRFSTFPECILFYFFLFYPASLDEVDGTSIERKQPVIREILNLCSNHKLQDVWRHPHPSRSQFTWRNNSLKVQCRLDYWLVSKDLFSTVTSTDITNPTFSDHSAVSLVIQSKDYAKRGPGFWKINNSILKDNKFAAELAAKILEYNESKTQLPRRQRSFLGHAKDGSKRLSCAIFEKTE